VGPARGGVRAEGEVKRARWRPEPEGDLWRRKRSGGSRRGRDPPTPSPSATGTLGRGSSEWLPVIVAPPSAVRELDKVRKRELVA
jgi:hypothetical protein